MPEAVNHMPGVWVDQLLEALFPARCVLCGLPGQGHCVCPDCRGDLPWLQRPCPRCALPSPPGGGCGRCPPHLLQYAHVHAPLAYAYPVASLVLAAKFGRQLEAARALGELLSGGCAGDCPAPDLVVPVPLHWQRHAARGFNQAEEMARVICRHRGWRLAAGLCRRVRATGEQSGLGVAARAGNLAGAFLAHAIPPGAHVLVVDDVLTTGATAGAVAEVLLARGAGRVDFWAAARTLSPAPAQPPGVNT